MHLDELLGPAKKSLEESLADYSAHRSANHLRLINEGEPLYKKDMGELLVEKFRKEMGFPRLIVELWEGYTPILDRTPTKKDMRNFEKIVEKAMCYDGVQPNTTIIILNSPEPEIGEIKFSIATNALSRFLTQ